MNKQIEQKLSSREVANMMDVRHDSLLRKIDKINEDLADHKIVVSKYWVEDSSPDNSGKISREFNITKRGCEYLAHKTTGTKGNLFTDKYMDRFEQMENKLQNPVVNIEPMSQILYLAENMQMMGQVVQGLQTFTLGLKEYVQDSIQAKDHQIDKAMELIGLRSKNVSRLTGKLKEMLFKKYGRTVNATDIRYINAKDKIFKEFKVYKWEEIPVGKYNSVFAFIEEIFY